MTTADGERIAPVTYLFRSRPDEAGSDDGARSPSAVASPEATAEPSRVPVFVDLGKPEAADERVTSLRAELEREARQHVSREGLYGRDDAEPAAPRRKGGSFAPISNVSMHALTRRGMSSREMHDHLVGREFDAGAVEDEVERLESVGLLDDVALAETLVRTLRERKGLGRSALTAELRRRKLDATAIEIAMEGLDGDELEAALQLAHKRAAQLRSYDTDTATRRLGAFLMRKGYSGSVVSTAVQRALAGSGSASSGPVFR